jgi:hypothetical protein
MPEPTLDLSTLILAVRSELENADLQLRSKAKPTLFLLSSMELEIHFVVKTTDEIKGGFDLKIVSLGSKLADSNETVQKIKVKWEVSEEAKSLKTLGVRHYDEDAPVRGDARSVTPRD